MLADWCETSRPFLLRRMIRAKPQYNRMSRATSQYTRITRATLQYILILFIPCPLISLDRKIIRQNRSIICRSRVRKIMSYPGRIDVF